MNVLVSIHDVTPAHGAAVRALWHLCTAAGVCPALLVVPNWHSECPLERHLDFVEWLRARAREGSSILLHGYRHDEVGLPRRMGDRFRALGRTAREGEFLALGAEEAGARIAAGATCLRALGLEPVGFVPPAWLARPEVHRVAAQAGFGISEDSRWVYVHPGRRLPAPCVRWSTRTALRGVGSILVAEGRWAVHRHAPLVRIALHPADASHAAVHRSVTRNLQRWVSVRRPVRYDELLAGSS